MAAAVVLRDVVPCLADLPPQLESDIDVDLLRRLTSVWNFFWAFRCGGMCRCDGRLGCSSRVGLLLISCSQLVILAHLSVLIVVWELGVGWIPNVLSVNQQLVLSWAVRSGSLLAV